MLGAVHLAKNLWLDGHTCMMTYCSYLANLESNQESRVDQLPYNREYSLLLAYISNMIPFTIFLINTL